MQLRHIQDLAGSPQCMVGQRPITAPLNSAEFGCSEENLSCSGGYPESSVVKTQPTLGLCTPHSTLPQIL